MAGNKLRLYVAYWRRTPSKTSNQIFHTGLLLIPKNPQNDERTTARYHVVNRIDPGTKLETWMFEPTLQLLPRTNKLSGLMLLGKVPPEFTAEGIEAILRTVHIPTPQELANIEARGDTWRCRYWVADALNVGTLSNRWRSVRHDLILVLFRRLWQQG